MDCHINTLKSVAIENDMGDCEFLKDESFRISNNFQLSTSQVKLNKNFIEIMYEIYVQYFYVFID